MKLDKTSESFEGRLARSRVKIVQEVAFVLKALDRIKLLLDEQTNFEDLPSITHREGSSGC
jgi:hypothetical protein